MVVKTKAKDRERELAEAKDFQRLAKEEAERQWREDSAMARAVLQELARNITEKKKMAVCESLAKIAWLESRCTMTHSQDVPLWCRQCQPDWPGSPYLQWKCVEHAAADIARSGASWCASLFGGPFA